MSLTNSILVGVESASGSFNRGFVSSGSSIDEGPPKALREQHRLVSLLHFPSGPRSRVQARFEHWPHANSEWVPTSTPRPNSWCRPSAQ